MAVKTKAEQITVQESKDKQENNQQAQASTALTCKWQNNIAQNRQEQGQKKQVQKKESVYLFTSHL